MREGTSPVQLARDVAPWGCAGLAVLAALLLDSRLSGMQFLPWIAGLLFFGLPHGACDHLVASRITGRRSLSDAVAFFALYLTISAAMLLLWLVSPTFALTAFLVFTAWHWGSADAMIHQTGVYKGGGYRGGFVSFHAASISRGLLVISAPVAFYPEASWAAFGTVMSSFGQTLTGKPTWLTPLAVGCLILSVTMECLLVYANLSRKEKSLAFAGATELLLLVGLFYLVSPVAAVGIYFVFWHAWRHVLRVGSLLRTPDPGEKPGAVALILEYHARAAPLTAISLFMLVVLSVSVGASSLTQMAGLYLILISALTLPHALLVYFWDLRTIAAESRQSPDYLPPA